MQVEGLLARYDALSREILKLVREGKKILVVTHIDADGIASGSIVFSALKRSGANVTLRCVPDIDPGLIASLASQKFDFYIFTDLASSLVGELESAYDGRFLVVDHHQLAAEDMGRPTVVNAWTYGIDGGKEACSSTMAYFFAVAVGQANRDLSPLAVVGAVADRQDAGRGRSLTGLNRMALDDALSLGLVSMTNDLMFTGRETRPVHESIALTSTPYLKGLTGSKDAVLAALHHAGLRLKDGGTWRTVSSLSAEEKMLLTETIAGQMGLEGGATETIASLVGEVYTLQFEDPFTPLRDAREFGTLLNACGRMNAAGIGVSICLGQRTEALAEAMKTLAEYRAGLNKAIQDVMEDASRVEERGKFVLIRGDGVVPERILGPVTSIVTSMPKYRDRIVISRATSGEAELKISSRAGDFYTGQVNLGLIMRAAAESVGGEGGGHSMAAGAKIPLTAADSFIKLVEEESSA